MSFAYLGLWTPINPVWSFLPIFNVTFNLLKNISLNLYDLKFFCYTVSFKALSICSYVSTYILKYFLISTLFPEFRHLMSNNSCSFMSYIISYRPWAHFLEYSFLLWACFSGMLPVSIRVLLCSLFFLTIFIWNSALILWFCSFLCEINFPELLE